MVFLSSLCWHEKLEPLMLESSQRRGDDGRGKEPSPSLSSPKDRREERENLVFVARKKIASFGVLVNIFDKLLASIAFTSAVEGRRGGGEGRGEEVVDLSCHALSRLKVPAEIEEGRQEEDGDGHGHNPSTGAYIYIQTMGV